MAGKYEILVRVTVIGNDDHIATPGDVAEAVEYAVASLGTVNVDVIADGEHGSGRLEGWMVDAAMVVRH